MKWQDGAHTLAIASFIAAAIIDFPFRRAPTRDERNVGNFVVSFGFLCLALAQRRERLDDRCG